MRIPDITVHGWTDEGPYYTIHNRISGWSNRHARRSGAGDEVIGGKGGSFEGPSTAMIFSHGDYEKWAFNKGFVYLIEVLVDGAERYLALTDRNDVTRFGFDAGAFAGLAEEVRLRLLKRAIDRIGHEGPVELGKLEALLAALDRAMADGEPRLKQTLAGAMIGLARGRIHIDPAPPRRGKSG